MTFSRFDTKMPFGKYKGADEFQIADWYPYYYLALCRKNKYFSPSPRCVKIAQFRTRKYLMGDPSDDDEDNGDW